MESGNKATGMASDFPENHGYFYFLRLYFSVRSNMPSVSFFFGISIYFYFSDHNPPHFHANYGKFWAEFDFNGQLINGDFPPRAAGLVVEWAIQHRDELEANWKLARDHKALKNIKPLE